MDWLLNLDPRITLGIAFAAIIISGSLAVKISDWLGLE